MRLWIGFACFFLSTLCAGPAQVLVIPAAEGTPILSSQGQQRAAYLVGLILRTTPPIVDQTQNPLSDFYVSSTLISCTQTIVPLFREGNYFSIETTSSFNTINFNMVAKEALPTLLSTIFQNPNYQKKTVVICVELSHIPILLPKLSSLPIQNGIYQITDLASSPIVYEGVPVNGFANW